MRKKAETSRHRPAEIKIRRRPDLAGCPWEVLLCGYGGMMILADDWQQVHDAIDRLTNRKP
jgi:hypothetical protein